MPNHHQSTHTEIDTTDAQPTVTGGAALSSDALARRRMLLKSLGKGTSVVAAAAAGSIHTLASGTTLTFTASGSRCTVSGTISGIHSKDTTKDTCRGLHPNVYRTNSQRWPSTVSGSYTVGNKTFTKNSTFSSVFGGGTSNSLVTVLNAASANNTPSESIWVAALLNALPNSGALNFPYSAQKVLDFYSATAIEKAKAETFFKGFMQTVIA